MKKPAKPWRPVPVAVQVAQHKAALAKKHHHPAKAAKAGTVKRAAKHHVKKRQWSPDCDVACCSARAVAVGPDGAWWSWGEPYSPADFPGAVIEEAWEVTWSL